MRLSSVSQSVSSTVTAHCDKKKKTVGSQQTSDKTGGLPKVPKSARSSGFASNDPFNDPLNQLSSNYSSGIPEYGDYDPLNLNPLNASLNQLNQQYSNPSLNTPEYSLYNNDSPPLYNNTYPLGDPSEPFKNTFASSSFDQSQQYPAFDGNKPLENTFASSNFNQSEQYPAINELLANNNPSDLLNSASHVVDDNPFAQPDVRRKSPPTSKQKPTEQASPTIDIKSVVIPQTSEQIKAEILQLLAKFPIDTTDNGKKINPKIGQNPQGTQEDLLRLSALLKEVKDKKIDIAIPPIEQRIKLYTKFFDGKVATKPEQTQTEPTLLVSEAESVSKMGVAGGRAKPPQLNTYETTATALIAAYKDINTTDESLKTLEEATDSALTQLRSLKRPVPQEEDTLLKQIKRVISLTASERRLKLAEKALNNNESKPELVKAVNQAKESVENARKWVMESLGTEEAGVFTSYLTALDALNPTLDKDSFDKALKAQEQVRKIAEGKLEDAMQRNPILNSYLSEQFNLLASDTTVRQNIHEFNNRINTQLAKLDKLKQGETIEKADLVELVTLYKVIQNSITEKGKNSLQDTFISEKALPFLEKINSQSGLALLEAQIELVMDIGKNQTAVITDHNELVDAHNDLVDEVRAYRNLTTDIISKTKIIVDELGQTNTKVTGLESELGTTKTKLGEAETKLSGLETKLGERVTMPMAGGLAAVLAAVSGIIAYFAAISGNKKDDKASSADESKKKMV